MRGVLFFLFFLIATTGSLIKTNAQTIQSDNAGIVDAFKLAVNTVDINVRRGILAAGGDYGGEWTRDIAINSWNCASLLRPQIALNSLWSVTVNKDSIGHQYWDKIIWTIAAMNHYKVTGDTTFLRAAYKCAKTTIKSLEQNAFDEKYGLFTGPSVFNDGIAGYPESVYDSSNGSSYVLDHPRSANIKCLSTNALYFGAYQALAGMSGILGDGQMNVYNKKASGLKASILRHLYDEKQNKLSYLIDSKGNVNGCQEGLGISFSILFGVLNPQQAALMVRSAHTSSYGIPSVWPAFARYSNEMPGRHNDIIWPMVNGFFADAAITSKNYDVFTTELTNIIHLALDEDKGNYNFREIYNADSGVPDGGWQRRNTTEEFHWTSFKNQTWSATAYLRMVFNGLLGFKFEKDGLYINPFLPGDVHTLKVGSLGYRKATINISIKGQGSHVSSFTVNGKKQKDLKISAAASGIQNVEVNLN